MPADLGVHRSSPVQDAARVYPFTHTKPQLDAELCQSNFAAPIFRHNSFSLMKLFTTHAPPRGNNSICVGYTRLCARCACFYIYSTWLAACNAHFTVSYFRKSYNLFVITDKFWHLSLLVCSMSMTKNDICEKMTIIFPCDQTVTLIRRCIHNYMLEFQHYTLKLLSWFPGRCTVLDSGRRHAFVAYISAYTHRSAENRSY